MSGSPHFQAYAKNLYRIGLIEMIDDLQQQSSRHAMRPSLVVNPVTEMPYCNRRMSANA